MNPLEELKAEFEKGQLEMGTVVDAFPWENKEAYVYWLGQTFCYASKSTRILALASAHFPPLHNNFHNRFIEHAREEKGHEKLLINDLKSLGYRLEDIPELPEMSAFYQCLYYWIEHINPVGLFGWVFCLEGLAVKKGGFLHERTRSAFGDRATSFLKVHSSEDVEHLASAFEVLNSLSEDEKKLILQNYRQCCALYSNVLTRIHTLCQKTSVPGKVA